MRYFRKIETGAVVKDMEYPGVLMKEHMENQVVN